MKFTLRPPNWKEFQIEVNPTDTDTDTDTVADVKRSIGTLQGAPVDLASQQILKDSSTLEENNVAENTSIVGSKSCEWCGPRLCFEARQRKPFKKEKAADFKEAVVYEKMKALEVEQKAEEERGLKKFSALITGLDAGAMEALRHHFEEDLSHHHRPLDNGPDAGAGATEALRLYFEEKCGSIEHLCFHHQDENAYIDFTSLESLELALQLDGHSVCGHPVNIYILLVKDSPFRAEIRGFDTGAKRLLEDHFKKNCEDIEAIIFPSPEYAYIDFVKEDSLYEALDLDNTIVGEHRITVKKAYYLPSQYGAVVRGFDTRANVKKALRKHFKSCGRIEEISLDDWGAYIAFASKDSLFKALDLSNSTMDGGCSITVRQPGYNFHASRFRAEVSWPNELNHLDLWPYFDKCGGIAGIRYSRLSADALIHFTNLGSLEEALKLDDTCILGSNHRFFVKNSSWKKCSLNRRKQIGMKSNFDN